jgi:hypothetical protein
MAVGNLSQASAPKTIQSFAILCVFSLRLCVPGRERNLGFFRAEFRHVSHGAEHEGGRGGGDLQAGFHAVGVQAAQATDGRERLQDRESKQGAGKQGAGHVSMSSAKKKSFGSPAISERSVALRHRLAAALP